MNTVLMPKGKRLVFLLVGVVLGVLATLTVPAFFSSSPHLDSNAYYAVFLSNNQVYFGKLSKFDTPSPVLSDVYYVQAFAAQDLSAADKSGSQLQLVKLGSELHQPQDVMYLNRDQVLFVEPLKPDSRIVSSIQSFKKTQSP